MNRTKTGVNKRSKLKKKKDDGMDNELDVTEWQSMLELKDKKCTAWI